MLRIAIVRSLCRTAQYILFITRHAALLAYPPVSVEDCQPGACWVKRHAERLAPLSQRGRQRCDRSRPACLAVSPQPRPMIAPSVVPVALWAAILPLILPRIFCDVLHAERAAAFWVLADQRRRIRALPTAVPVPLSGPAKGCLESLRALPILANEKYSFPLQHARAGH